MVDFFHKLRSEQKIEPETQEIQPQHILVAGAGLEILRDIRDKIELIEIQIAELERKLEERIPEKVLTEKKFREEVQTGDEIADKIISEVRILAQTKSVREIIQESVVEEKPTIVEFKKIERITSLLQQHGKLSSSQLAQLMNLSRTRCNEYFKQMEKLGIAEPILIGKEKFYKLRS